MSKGTRKLGRWEESRELDKIAVPLIEEFGVEVAYEKALEEMEGRDVGD